MPERVLVTGATGFVGSHVAEAFIEAGYEVRLGARASSDLRWISTLDAERVPLDVSANPQNFSRAVRRVDTIIHAAGITRARRAGDYYAVNADGTRRLAAAALRAGVRRFVLVSSLAARGPDGRGQPDSDYGWSKLAAERHLHTLEGRMETVVLRPSAVYGPRDTDLLPLFRLARAGWLPVPSQAAPLQPLYAVDAARAVLAAAREPAGFGPFPVAENLRYTWSDVVAGLGKTLGRPVRAARLPAPVFVLAGRAAERAARAFSAVPDFDERRARDLALNSWTCDVSESGEALGWRAEVPLPDGLERTASWYGREGWLGMMKSPMNTGERRPEILFATIAAGGGHVAVARAMAEAIEHHYPGRFELRVSDYMKEVGAKRVADLDRLHKDTWRFMLRFPILARTSQRLMDAFPRTTVAAQRRLVRGFARAAADDLSRDPPRLVFSNHGLMTAGLAEAKRIGGLQIPVLSFANELVGICSYWADPRADRIIVPSEEARRDLMRFGVPESKLTFVGFGYPVRQAFLTAPAKHEARARLGLEERFTCLLSSGGEGVGRNQRELVRALLGSDVPLQVVVVAGRNERLKEELRALGTEKNLLRIEGYVEDMATYLAASDVFVGKAGPASVYEAIVVGRPALVTGYAGLNEVGVARLVEEKGLGSYVKTSRELLGEVRRYARDPVLLEEVARRCRSLEPAAASERLAHYVVRYAELGEDAA